MTSIKLFQQKIVATLLSDDDIRAEIDHELANLKMCGSKNEDALKLIFRSPGTSLRLTSEGNQIMQLAYKPYTITVNQRLTMRQRLMLVHECRYPYYLQSDEFTTYDRMLGMKLRLAEGNIERIEEVLFR